MSAAEVYDELDAAIVEATAPDGADRPDFTVHDTDSADWALRVVARHERRFEEFEAAAARAIDVCQTRIDHERERIEAERQRMLDGTAYLRSLLEGYHRLVLEADEKRKTIRLPAGNLVARKQPDVVDVTDPDAFLVWAAGAAPQLVRTTVAPDKAAIKKLAHRDGLVVDAAGEVVPGVAWVEGDVTFKVDTKAAGQ